MRIKEISNQMEHIDIVVKDIQKLRNLDEDFIYEIEGRAGFEYDIDMIADVSIDAMLSWKKVLRTQVEDAIVREPGSKCYDLTFKELRERSGMNKTEFASCFNIPYRTVQNWELGLRPCPQYLLELMEYKLNIEKAKGEV